MNDIDWGTVLKIGLPALLLGGLLTLGAQALFKKKTPAPGTEESSQEG